MRETFAFCTKRIQADIVIIFVLVLEQLTLFSAHNEM